jgi:predicted transglutaminase-like cysteine proteinase
MHTRHMTKTTAYKTASDRAAAAREANIAVSEKWSALMNAGDRAAAAAAYVRFCQLSGQDCDRTDAHPIHDPLD